MLAAIVDTHALLWYLLGDARLSRRSRAFLDQIAVGGDQAGISSITFAEIVYLTEKRRIPRESFTRVADTLTQDALIIEIPVDRAVARAMFLISLDQVPDMPDRIIAATALHLGVSLISRDGRIRASNVETVW
jgi:PIN domain nuclease of toxin-antitoxin system